MNTTPSRTTDLSKTATPADDPERSTTDAVVTEDTTATAAPAEDTDEAEDDEPGARPLHRGLPRRRRGRHGRRLRRPRHRRPHRRLVRPGRRRA
ncbi:hypothetical protein J7E90_11410 [Streptomyces sp. ISL-111]|uniref:hypothetical protein n=1 Tax=Streptomyces sp. ISL-111 TaxID=2819175 RepID=UPI001BE7DAE3|nr:hypothetical protein [Streptomyces sp. ISL-111]